MSGEGREQTMMQILVPSLFPFKNKTEHGMSMAACWNNWQIYVTRDVIDNYMEYRKYIKKNGKKGREKTCYTMSLMIQHEKIISRLFLIQFMNN